MHYEAYWEMAAEAGQLLSGCGAVDSSASVPAKRRLPGLGGLLLMLHLLAGLIWGKHGKEEAVIDVLSRRLWLLYVLQLSDAWRTFHRYHADLQELHHWPLAGSENCFG